jgi:hypothetical protein
LTEGSGIGVVEDGGSTAELNAREVGGVAGGAFELVSGMAFAVIIRSNTRQRPFGVAWRSEHFLLLPVALLEITSLFKHHINP